MNSLPNEILGLCFIKLHDPHQIRTCSLVCKKWMLTIENSLRLQNLRKSYPLFYSCLDEQSLARCDPHAPHQQLIYQEKKILNKYIKELYSFESNPIKNHKKLKDLVYKHGIPTQKRATIWKILTNSDAYAQNLPSYQELLSDPSKFTSVEFIDKDTPRIPKTSGGIQQKLWRLCNAFTVVQSKFNYFGGMHYVPYFLLQFMEEEDAFWVFYALMFNPKYYSLLQIDYTQTMEMDTYFQHFEHSLQQKLAQISALLTQQAITPMMYAYQWFKLLFLESFNSLDLGRIWDIIMYEGGSIIIPIAVAMVESRFAEDSDDLFRSILNRRSSADLDKLLPRIKKFHK